MTSPDAEAARKRRHRNERIVAALVVLLAAAITAGIARWTQREQEHLERDRR